MSHPNEDNESSMCPICFDSLENSLNIVTLDCGHKFHYDCIIDWFKQKKIKNPYSNSGKSIRVCPYCREKSGFLTLPEKTFPIKHIHKEYKHIEYVVNLDDQAKILEVCKPYFNPKYCFCILKTGASKGQQCRKYKKKGSDYCFIHKKKMEEKQNNLT